MSGELALLGALLSALLAVAAVHFVRSRAPPVAAESVSADGRTPRLGQELVLALSRDVRRVGYWVSVGAGGRDWRALADTGSPFLLIPRSLPCRGAPCPATGLSASLVFGDGASDPARFVRGGVRLGGGQLPGLVFAGNSGGGKGADADIAVLGLNPGLGRGEALAAAAAVAQMGVGRLSFDLGPRPTLTLSPPDAPAPPERGGFLAAGALLSPAAIREAGAPQAADFYVAALDPRRGAAAGLPPLRLLVFDTGTTLTLLPAPLPAGKAFALPLADGGEIPVQGRDAGALPGDLVGAGLAILGNRSLTGLRLALDLRAGRFAVHRVQN